MLTESGGSWPDVTNFFFRFMVRDFQYNEEEMKADKEELTRLSTDKKKQFVCAAVYIFIHYWTL